MKKLLPLSFAALFILASSGCQKSENFYQYPFKTARINYQISGTSVGTSEVVIKDDLKVIKDQITKKGVDGKEEKSNRIVISTPDKVYLLNPDLKTGTSYPNVTYQELKKLPAEKRQEKLLVEYIQQSKPGAEKEENVQVAKSEGTEEIAGQKCEIYKTEYSTSCFWAGIPLKTTIDMSTYGVNVQTVATKIEVNPELDDSLFQVPSDYKIQELK